MYLFVFLTPSIEHTMYVHAVTYLALYI